MRSHNGYQENAAADKVVSSSKAECYKEISKWVC
jgi:hypothetical protein